MYLDHARRVKFVSSPLTLKRFTRRPARTRTRASCVCVHRGREENNAQKMATKKSKSKSARSDSRDQSDASSDAHEACQHEQQ